MANTKEQDAAYIAALLRERAGLVINEDEEALAAVDAELKRVGHKASAPAKRAEKRAQS
jgi:hypothetical protein